MPDRAAPKQRPQGWAAPSPPPGGGAKAWGGPALSNEPPQGRAAPSPALARAPVALRLFFALWPDADTRARLARHMRQWRFTPPARPGNPAKLHLTLLFLEGVDPARVAQLRAIGADVAAATGALELSLRDARVWPQGGIAHLAPRPQPALHALHDTLRERVLAAGIDCDRRAFRPHVTLARRTAADAPPAGFAPLPWHADTLALVHSVLGTGRYDLLEQWRLSGT